METLGTKVQAPGTDTQGRKIIKTVTLPSGKVATLSAFKGKDVREAQKRMGEDSSFYMFALLSLVGEIDGAPFVMEDLDEMDGGDVIMLQKEFAEINF